MEKSIKLGLASMMIASSVLFSCSTSSEKVEQAEENVVDSKNELKEEKEAYQKEQKEYRKNAEKRIAENEKNIAEFNQRIKNQKADAKKDYEQKIADLNQKKHRHENEVSRF
jgi:septal ring factor EnvC (AmiA/AmiB activator)